MNNSARVFFLAYLAEPVIWLAIALALKAGFAIGVVASATVAGVCDCVADISDTLVPLYPVS